MFKHARYWQILVLRGCIWVLPKALDSLTLDIYVPALDLLLLGKYKLKMGSQNLFAAYTSSGTEHLWVLGKKLRVYKINHARGQDRTYQTVLHQMTIFPQILKPGHRLGYAEMLLGPINSMQCCTECCHVTTVKAEVYFTISAPGTETPRAGLRCQVKSCLTLETQRKIFVAAARAQAPPRAAILARLLN